MQINSNITAIITNNALLRNESAFKLSTGKLSSGYKINTAGDDPTGYAISGRMRQQLEALKRADVNGTTGKSVLETADGALAEVTDMIQRLNELSIKASNGTMAASDRADIQQEVDQLTDEIKRISEQIELNGQKLLDGHLENHGYCENNKFVHVEEYNDKVDPGKLNNFTIKETVDAEGDGYVLNVKITGFPKDGSPDIELKGMKYPAYIDDELARDGYSGKAVTTGVYEDPINGSVKICEDGSQYITVKGPNGEEMTVLVEPDDTNGVKKETVDYMVGGGRYEMNKYTISAGSAGSPLQLTLTGKGAMELHVGANEEEIITCSLPKISLERLDLDDLSLATRESARASIDRIDHALSYVSKARSQI